MSLDKRSTALLMELINATSYLSIKELIEKFNVSRRTIYYDMGKINHWLKEQGLDQVQKIRSVGFILTDKTKENIPATIGDIEPWHYEYSSSERKAWLAIYILSSEEKLYLENLMTKVRFSRNTTIEDIKALKTEINKFNLQLGFDRNQGYIFEGKETDIRKAIVYYLSIALPEQSWESLLNAVQMHIHSIHSQKKGIKLFEIHSLKVIHQFISISEKKFNIRFTDEMLHSLALRFVLFINRLKQGYIVTIDGAEKEVLRETNAFKVAQYISERLKEVLNINIPEEEQYHLTTHLLGAKMNYSEDEIDNESLNETLQNVAINMINDFQRYACILFQDRDLLMKNLLVHLKPTYYRIKYGLDIENQLTDAVKSKYKEIFTITKRVVHHFEQVLGQTIQENEIAYIAMHLGGWMKKEGAATLSRKKALIVCATGVGTSQILRQQLEGLFSTIDITEIVSVREYEQGSFDVDLVISTTPVTKKEHPIFVVNPILTDSEKEALLKNINLIFEQNYSEPLSVDGILDLVEHYATIHDKEKLQHELKHYVNRPLVSIKENYKPNLTDLLTENMIQFCETVDNWKNAIRVAAEPLLQNGYITNHYIEAMILNVEHYGPYIVIAPGFAIPHAKPEDGVHKLGMTLLRLTNPVSFSNQEKHNVRFIVVLAAINNEAHLKALAQLTNIFSNNHDQNILKEASNEKQIVERLNQLVN